jgi:hypothetical protein
MLAQQLVILSGFHRVDPTFQVVLQMSLDGRLDLCSSLLGSRSDAQYSSYHASLLMNSTGIVILSGSTAV